MKKRHVIFLLLILCLAAFPRFYHLHQQGFISWDEGMYMNEAVFYASVVNHLPEIISGFLDQTINGSFLIDMIEGWPPSSAKPLHSFLIYLFSLLMGMSVYTAQFMSVIFSLGCIILVFFLARAYFNQQVALFSALFLACSGYHIYVSRLGVPETNSTFFYLMSLYIIERFKTHRSLIPFFFSGITLGLCFGLNYRWIIVIPIAYIVLATDILFHREYSPRVYANRLGLSLVGFITIPLLCHLPYLPLAFVNDLSISFRHMDGNVFSYFDQLGFYLLFQSHAGAFYVHSLYIRYFTELNGIMMSSLALIGFFVLLHKPHKGNIVCILSGLIPFVLLSVKSRGNSIRYISIVLPFLSIYAAVAVYYLFSVIRSEHRLIKFSKFLFIIYLCFSAFFPVLQFTGLNSGYAEAAAFLRENSGARNLSTSNAYFEYYFGRNVAEKIPDSLNDIEALLRAGNYRFIVLDFMSHRVLRAEAKAFIESQCTPCVSIENPIGRNIYTLMESLGYRHFIPGYLENALADPNASKITVYRAEDVLDALREIRE
jgi:4-amino-4-deoxy-L-arabinose transferase-like glycosyltransferase